MSKKERNAAIYSCHDSGMKQVQIAKAFNIAQSTVSEILRARNTPEKAETRGVKPYLSEAQKIELSELLKGSPEEYGYYLWSKHSVKVLIEEKFKVSYHENYIWKLMKDIGFSSQKPQLRDYRKDEEKVKVFKEEKAFEIKKK